MTVFRGLGDDVPDRLRRFIFPLEKALVDRDLVYWGALHGISEMIEGGVTTFADMYYFEEEVARAARQAGIRGVLGQTVVNFPAPDAPAPYGGIERAQRFIAEFRGDPLITPAFAPHAPYTVDAARLREIGRLATELNAPVLIHLAEMTDEVATLRREHQRTPVEYLDDLGLLNRRLVAAHCIFVNETDLALLRLAAERMRRELDAAWRARVAGLPLKTSDELLTLASIVEKESARADERDRIAGVFVSRLRLGMKLQTDPTVIYGIGDSYDGDIRRRDLETDTPYNTYTRAGLTPTPIALPSAAALRAAARPRVTGELFFVATGDPDGAHRFSRTYPEHQQAVAEMLVRQRTRRAAASSEGTR
jgi:hypothetical protein